MSDDRKFLAYFDCEGFECIIDITRKEQEMLIKSIKGEQIKDTIGLNMMMLRARYNPQRSPEIWVFTSEIELKELLEISQESPQVLVDAIRKNGNCIWKNTPVKQVIK